MLNLNGAADGAALAVILSASENPLTRRHPSLEIGRRTFCRCIIEFDILSNTFSSDCCSFPIHQRSRGRLCTGELAGQRSSNPWSRLILEAQHVE